MRTLGIEVSWRWVEDGISWIDLDVLLALHCDVHLTLEIYPPQLQAALVEL